MFLLADSQLQPRSWQGSRLLHKTFPAFWLPKKKTAPTIRSLRLEYVPLVMMTIRPRKGMTFLYNGQWLKEIWEIHVSIQEVSMHCVLSKKTWKLDQLTSIHPTDKLKACCSEVTLERYPKTPLSSWVQKVDWRNINKRCQEKKQAVIETCVQTPCQQQLNHLSNELPLQSSPDLFSTATRFASVFLHCVQVYWGLVPHLPISSKALFHLMSNLPKKKAQNGYGSKFLTARMDNCLPYLKVWIYDSQHDHICVPIVRTPNSEPHPNVKFSLTGAVSKSRTVPTAAQHELVLDSKKTNQLCKEPSKTETNKNAKL